MKMRRILALVMAVLAALALTGCSARKESGDLLS